jgi:HK97 family phage major capsid protein
MAATATQHPQVIERQARPRFSLTEKELRNYSLARAILVSADNQEGSERAERSCFELEVSQTIEKTVTGKRYGGIFVPWNIGAGEFERKGSKSIQTRACLSSNVATTGQELKFTAPGDFLEYLYNRMRVKELGATTVTGLRDNVAYPKQTGKATGSWVAENPGADVADSNLTLGQVPSPPKTYQSSTSYSRQLLAQAAIDVDTLSDRTSRATWRSRLTSRRSPDRPAVRLQSGS